MPDSHESRKAEAYRAGQEQARNESPLDAGLHDISQTTSEMYHWNDTDKEREIFEAEERGYQDERNS